MTNDMETLLDAFLYETNGLLDRMDEILVQDEELSTLSSEDVNEIFRIMHTTKSSSAMMGYNCMSVVAHKIEDLFSYIRDKNEGLNFLADDLKKSLFNLLFTAEDYLKTQMTNIEQGNPVDENIAKLEDDIALMLSAITGQSDSVDTTVTTVETVAPEETVVASVASPAEVTPVVEETSDLSDLELPEDDDAQIFIHITLKPNLRMENLRAFMIVNAVKESGLTFRWYPADMETNTARSQEIIDKGFFLAFDSLENCEIAEEILRGQHHIDNFNCIDAPKSSYLNVAKAAQEEAIAKENVPVAKTEEHKTEEAKPSTNVNHGPVKKNLISVNLSKLDQLNNIVGEIVITESMVTSSPVLQLLPQEAIDAFTKSARQLSKLTNDLQDISMSLRMVPVSGVFQKMNRVVRDMKTKLGKPVHLQMIGDDTEVDKTILDAIQDPIMHLVRNCMDHGIEESIDERIEAGKPEEGTITLSATNTSSEVVITVADDGYGMDTDRILDKAERMNLLTKPKEKYTRKEALNLILLPGFSTNTEVTEYSGRGVGMDVVRRNIESIGGNIMISSEYGEGTEITFKIPLTLAIVDGMKVAVGDTIFTISISSIRQSFKITDDEVIRDEFGNPMVCKQGDFYPIIRLDEFFDIKSKSENFSDGILIWVEASDQSYCILVDDLIGQQQVVVKPLPPYLNKFNLKGYGINGCTILGDGTISIILDVLGLYNSTYEDNRKEL